MTAIDVAKIVSRLVAPLSRRVRLIASRAVVTLIDDAKKRQLVQADLLADETKDSIEHFQPFGFSSHPPKGSEGLFLSVGADRAHGVVLCVESRDYRPTGLAEGEAVLYTKDGVRVRLKADKKVEIGTSPSDFVALASLVKGELDKIAGEINKLTAHTHPTGVGPSGPPTPAPSYTASAVAAAEVKAK